MKNGRTGVGKGLDSDTTGVAAIASIASLHPRSLAVTGLAHRIRHSGLILNA